ncbi:MAG: hypothetical protein HC824_00835 [Synechococcales cyanobacterium RM1_1_8]|nr:hypothetical protein [Synechococcales cyanobacterium RM1_1_8]
MEHLPLVAGLCPEHLPNAAPANRIQETKQEAGASKEPIPRQSLGTKQWVETQQQQLKASQWQSVVQAAQRLPPKSPELTEKVERLVSYLTTNQERIDYKRYLKRKLMIGSGVVESSNRRIVTVRLKQSGMFWSKNGAQAVMVLRAAYLSASSTWHNFWLKNALPS